MQNKRVPGVREKLRLQCKTRGGIWLRVAEKQKVRKKEGRLFQNPFLCDRAMFECDFLTGPERCERGTEENKKESNVRRVLRCGPYPDTEAGGRGHTGNHGNRFLGPARFTAICEAACPPL